MTRTKLRIRSKAPAVEIAMMMIFGESPRVSNGSAFMPASSSGPAHVNTFTFTNMQIGMGRAENGRHTRTTEVVCVRKRDQGRKM